MISFPLLLPHTVIIFYHQSFVQSESMVRIVHILCLVICSLGFHGDLYGQYFVSSEYLGMRTEAELTASFGQPVRSSVQLFRMRYMTENVQGLPDTASGLLVVPNAPLLEKQPIVIYQHGTTNGPADVPSRLAAGTSESLAYGGMGYFTIAPDYLGLGDHMGFHPYVHAATEASAARDMLFAVTEMIETITGEPWQDDLFISGYSQGGHAAAALQRELEQNWSHLYPVTASTPMSGPYSISGVMYEKIISNDVYFLPAYIAYVALAYQEAYGNLYTTLSDIFKPAYTPIIQNFRNHTINTTTMNILLVNQLFLEGGTSRPRLMFKTDVLQEIMENENHPFRIALHDNDVYDWAPQVPTRLYYCTADEQVPFENSILAETVMRANGAPDVEAINFGALNHSNCAPPAIRASITFFDAFIFPSTTRDLVVQERAFVHPNPVRGTLLFNQNIPDAITDIHIADMAGRLMMAPSRSAYGIDVSVLAPGMYIVHARIADVPHVQRIVVVD